MTVRALRFGSLSTRWYRRPTVVAVVLALLAGLAGFAVLSWGSAVSVGDTFATLLGRGTPLSDLVVFKIRMPRVAAALIVGVCLGIGGTLFQSLTRNPLGSPEIVGFTYGASAGAVLVLLVIGEQAISVSTGAIGLGFLTALAMYLLAWRGGVHGVRLVLIGVAVSAMLEGLVSYLLIRADLYDAQAVHVWLVGSLGAVNWDQVQLVAFVAAVAVPAAALLARPLDMLGMGDDAARSLGLPAELVRLAVLVTAVALTGVAVAAVGPIAFVALTAPQLARRLTRHPGVGVLSSGAMGAVLLVAADLVARALPLPGQLPVGVVTGGLGGAYLSWLLWRERRAGRW
jgi:iron complex transport system permease protein